MVSSRVAVDYAPASSFGWLDYDEKAAQRMREVLRAFEEKNTIDSLGLGVVRDALADQLFPGTSTIQTRARYFFFVPWIYQHPELRDVAPREVDRKARELEVELIKSLRAGYDNTHGEGVIGAKAGKRTKRLASSVYWNGLATFGLRLYDGRPSELRRMVLELGKRGGRVLRDDNGEVISGGTSLWARVPPPPENFPYEPITMDMTKAEAAYLAEAIQTKRPESLLAYLASRPERVADYEAPWDVEPDELPPKLRELVSHARRFSDVMHGANVLYNVMLCEAAQREGLDPEHAQPDEQRAALEEWEGGLQAQLEDIRRWFSDMPAFWRVVEAAGRVPERTRKFVEWWVRCVAEDPTAPRTNPAVRKQLELREAQIKSPPRLTNRRALERWNGQAFGAAQFSFRFATVQRFMADIAQGVEEDDDALA